MTLQHRYPDEFMPSKYFLAKNNDKTFQFDDQLPSLPIPSLKSTLSKYLESVKPHLTREEIEKTVQAVRRFAENEGPKLQSILEERAKAKRNWLEEWWLSYAYLKLRIPVTPLMNVTGIAPYVFHLWPPSKGTQVTRNSLSTYFLLEHWQLIKRQKLLHDSGRSGKEPWSMYQFRSLYNCCRLPGLEEDTICRYFKTDEEGESPSHLVVFCNRRIYKIDSVLDSKGRLFTPPQLKHVLSRIKEEAYSQEAGPGLSSLTTLDRSTWYKLRQHLVSLSHTNAQHLHTIQSAIIGSSLVDDTPSDMSQLSQQGLLGKPGNAWYDKSYSSIWFENGTTVSNCDHAPMDAMTSVNVSFYADCRLIECEGVWKGENEEETNEVPSYHELHFTIDKQIEDGIAAAESSYLKLARNIEIINPEFHTFGKDLFKELKLHPDTFVQVCLQYAYYKLHGKPAATYETATTRKFYNGRTETVRSCTNEVVAWAKVMLDKDSLPSQKIHLFKNAMNKHLSMMRECMSGQGIDRHLFGLKIVAAENGFDIPDIFIDPAYEKSGGNGNFTLSTSFVGFTSVHGGVAPMCSNGYGCFYRIGAKRIVFFISSWISDEGTSAVKLYASIADCMNEVIDLLSNNTVSSI